MLCIMFNAAKLKELRIEKNLSQQDLAVAIGSQMSLINKLENGHTNPTFGTVEAIADYFGISLDLLRAPGEARKMGPKTKKVG